MLVFDIQSADTVASQQSCMYIDLAVADCVVCEDESENRVWEEGQGGARLCVYSE